MQRILLSLLFLMPACTCAQEVHRLTGYIQMPGEPLISYFVQFVVNGTEVSGYTITDYKEGNRLRASLIGKLSPASELYIEENGSLDGPRSPFQTYCYFKAKLKLSISGGRQQWSGTFESNQQLGTPCGGGTMTLLDEVLPAELPKPKPAPKSLPIPIVKTDRKEEVKAPHKDTMKPLPDPPKPIIVDRPKVVQAPRDTNNCLRNYDWSTDELTFEIFDGWTIDGDIVSISLNGIVVLDHEKLTGVKRRISTKLKPGLNIITIFFQDDGIDSPNTPNMVLHNGDKQYELDISGKTGESAQICISRMR